MTLFLLAMGLLLGSGLAALCVSRRPVLSTWFGAGGAVTGCLLAMIPAVAGLQCVPAFFRCDWSVPGGSFIIQIDPLSAFFLIPILGLSLLAAIYGTRYMLPYAKTRGIGGSWLSYNLLVVGMAMVVVSRNAVLFLMAWEVMAVASFFLVTFEHEKREVRDAGWTYLVASHVGTAFLLAFFLLVGKDSLDFDSFVVGAAPGLLFLLAIVGFGTKAGFMPFHVWLPEAHPAAPSHVSALMSGVMIKTGIYGLLRALTFLGPPPPWWGWVIVAIGFTSGVMGVLFALAQHDLKRLLAYHSVENIGIIALGIGTGLLGVSYHQPALAVLGFAGGLLHVVNHALFKGLLFLGAGAVAHGAHTREIDHLGGLLKRMPWTGGTFLIGAAAICGLPPLNGFVSEFLIYLGAYEGVKLGGHETAMGVAVIAGLALIGGLAAACFCKAFGVVFLGEPRTREAAEAHEATACMIVPMVVLAGGCLFIGLFGPVVFQSMGPVIAQVTSLSEASLTSQTVQTTGLLWNVTLVAGALILSVLAVVTLRRTLLRGKEIGSSETWGCGYAHPTARMQYSASSFAQPLTRLFGSILRVRKKEVSAGGLFPKEASFETHTDDVARQWLYRPMFLGIGRVAGLLRVIQHGLVNVYILYIALTLAVLLIWKLS